MQTQIHDRFYLNRNVLIPRLDHSINIKYDKKRNKLFVIFIFFFSENRKLIEKIEREKKKERKSCLLPCYKSINILIVLYYYRHHDHEFA